MVREVRLNRVRNVLDDLPYPLSKARAMEELSDVTLRYADGEEPLAEVIGRSNEDEFDSSEELESEVYSTVPTEAVGEPGQSEGEG